MEHFVARLLNDFERGRITRRQLVESLAVLATAASLHGAEPRPASNGKNLKAVAVNHISYRVADYAKTRDFYADLLGMKIMHDNGQQCSLVFGDSFLIPRNWPTDTPRIDHVAYTIENWDKDSVEGELKRRGLHPQPDTENSFHVQDPNGFDLQISGKGMKP